MLRTIRQISRELDVPEHFLRELVAKGLCPGIYSGSRFYIHKEKFEALLDEMSTRAGKSKELL